MERIDIAFVAAFPEGENSAIYQLMYSIDIVKDEYYQDPTYFGINGWVLKITEPRLSIKYLFTQIP